MCVVIGAMQKCIVIISCACLLPGYTWEHLDLPGTPGYTWVHLGTPGYTWVHLGIPGYTREHLDLPGPPDVQTDGHQKTACQRSKYLSTVWNLNIPDSLFSAE